VHVCMWSVMVRVDIHDDVYIDPMDNVLHTCMCL
jgi:hypothetical protein